MRNSHKARSKTTRTADIRVVLADRETLNLHGMSALLKDVRGVKVVGTTHDAAEVFASVKDGRPQVLLIEAPMLDQVGDRSLLRLRKAAPDLHILLLSGREAAPRAAALAPPEALGMVYRDGEPRSLIQAIKAVAGGRGWEMPSRPVTERAGRPLAKGLSPREDDIASLVSQGYSNRLIAQRLGLSEQSVKNLVSRILRKLGLRNRVQVALWHWAAASPEA
ncbi:MAG: response regulator transcription factor [Armatimonadetes bacterium]|nr:response regulator transcription factor [Armatimonadota bacterium]